MGGGDVPTGVGKTALGVAMVRAEESRRGDRLFDDPYAAAFLAAATARSSCAPTGSSAWRHLTADNAPRAAVAGVLSHVLAQPAVAAVAGTVPEPAA
jgi:O-methyltransferase involved in polyketide biosynthesis